MTLLKLPVGAIEELDICTLKCLCKKKIYKHQVNFEKGKQQRPWTSRSWGILRGSAVQTVEDRDPKEPLEAALHLEEGGTPLLWP